MTEKFRLGRPVSAWFLLGACVFDIIFAFPGMAFAYTDPNTGNLIFQILFPLITIVSTGYLVCRNFLKRKFASWKKIILNTARSKSNSSDNA
jgi:hypothetical protein